jgi:membrane protease YdiL (CAAX protease family)
MNSAVSNHESLGAKPGAWTELALTLPIFLAYQLGVVFLNVRNGTDVVSAELLEASHGDRILYLAVTALLGAAMIGVFALFGRGQAFQPRKFAQIALEGAAYAVAMSTAASWVVGKLFAGPNARAVGGVFPGLVMSLGAGFYEELAFRVLLFGVGLRVWTWLLSPPLRRRVPARGGLRDLVVGAGWAIACACVFSGVHYVGSLGDAFDARSFVARGVLGLALTTVYVTRGFATAVWTHALYDIWVLVF